jgi:hypothetical protein
MMHPPVYTPETVQVGILQGLQTLLERPTSATLAEVAVLLSSMQQEYGEMATLEHVIQHRVGRELASQRAAHKQRRQQGVVS